MHPAVELLIKRMESNPEEFVVGHKRGRHWGALIERNKQYMTKQERETIGHKFSEIQMNQMHKEIMAELLRVEEKNEDPFTTMSLPF